MAHLALFAPALAGHLLPGGALARELIRRGHQVTVVSFPRAAQITQKLDLPLVELPDVGPLPKAGLTLSLARLIGLGVPVRYRRRLQRVADTILCHGPEALQTLRPDAVIVDQDMLAGSSVAEHLGLPYLTLTSGLPWNREDRLPPHYTGWQPRAGALAGWRNRWGYAGWQFYQGLALRRINESRREWNLRPLRQADEVHSGAAQLVQLSAELDFPNRQLPLTFHYVGSLSSQRPQTTDTFPWERLDGRPLIFASLGTLPGAELAQVFRTIAQACDGLPAQLVLGLGKWNEQMADTRRLLGELPGAPIVVDFAPQLALLDRAAMMITHAGLNTVLEALTRGVPMVALPRGTDHPGIAARLAYHGAALTTPCAGVTVRKLHPLVERVFADDSFRTRARQLGTSLQAAGGVSRAADIVEQAFGWRR